MHGLTKGTREWKQALVENNQEVLELLNTYPELADHVIKGEDGELSISQEGWDYLTNQQMTGYTAAINAKTAMTQ